MHARRQSLFSLPSSSSSFSLSVPLQCMAHENEKKGSQQRALIYLLQGHINCNYCTLNARHRPSSSYFFFCNPLIVDSSCGIRKRILKSNCITIREFIIITLLFTVYATLTFHVTFI